MTTPRTIAAALLLLVLASPAIAQTAAGNQCITCHRELEGGEGPAHDFTLDVHARRGFACNDCHGGDPALDDMDAVRASAGWRGVPDRQEIPAFCARCHSDAAYMHEHNPLLPIDQLDKYKTSIHGRRLLQDNDPKVATCVSCHTAHRIGDAAMPHSSTNPTNLPATCGACHSNSDYMAGYGIPTDQEALYRSSVHGHAVLDKKDLSAPVCNDCHGNHGAAPPGITSLSAVCGMCHALEADLYTASPHQDAFAAMEMPMCETCHGNHGIVPPDHTLIGFGDDQICGTCHADDGSSAASQIDSMTEIWSTLGRTVDSAQVLLADAASRGMMTTDEEFIMKEVEQNVINLRTAVHAFSIDSSAPLGATAIEKSRVVAAGAADLVDEYYFRRWGLGISSILITLLAVALFLKIRAIERP